MALTGGFSSEPLAANKRTLLADQCIQLPTVLCWKALSAAGIAALKLSLALAVLFKLGGCISAERRCRYRRRGFDTGNRQKGKASCGIENVDECSDGDEQAECECQCTLSIYYIVSYYMCARNGTNIRFSVSRFLK